MEPETQCCEPRSTLASSEESLRLGRNELDGANADPRIPSEFTFEVTFTPVQADVLDLVEQEQDTVRLFGRLREMGRRLRLREEMAALASSMPAPLLSSTAPRVAAQPPSASGYYCADDVKADEKPVSCPVYSMVDADEEDKLAATLLRGNGPSTSETAADSKETGQPVKPGSAQSSQPTDVSATVKDAATESIATPTPATPDCSKVSAAGNGAASASQTGSAAPVSAAKAATTEAKASPAVAEKDEIDALFDDFDTTLSGGPPSKTTSTTPASAPALEKSAGAKPSEDDDIFGGVDAFLKDLEGSGALESSQTK